MNYILINELSDLKQAIESTISQPRSCNNNDDKTANMWAILFNHSLMQNISSAYLKTFLKAVISNRRKQVMDIAIPPSSATFYIWVDEQTGHLCFNLVFCEKENLPFGCTVKFVESIDSILHTFLISPIQAGIVPFSEIIEIELEEKVDVGNDSAHNYVLSVHAIDLIKELY